MVNLRGEYLGKVFTTLQGSEATIIEYNSGRDITIRFEDTGFQKKTTLCNVKRGSISNPYFKSVYGVGYLGVGEYKSKHNKKQTVVYRTWSAIMSRCYNEKSLKKHPSYIGCTVCEEWLNFQNFGKWFEENFNPKTMQGWNVDKDILVKGNKIYSPEYCMIIPKILNNSFVSTSKKKEGTVGVNYYTKDNAYVAQGNTGKKNTNYIGQFKNQEDAIKAYANAKEKYIKELADEWRELIGERAYKGLINYKF